MIDHFADPNTHSPLNARGFRAGVQIMIPLVGEFADIAPATCKPSSSPQQSNSIIARSVFDITVIATIDCEFSTVPAIITLSSGPKHWWISWSN